MKCSTPKTSQIITSQHFRDEETEKKMEITYKYIQPLSDEDCFQTQANIRAWVWGKFINRNLYKLHMDYLFI